MKIDLGSGTSKKESYLTIDKNPDIKADIIADVEERLPFKDCEVDEIRASHILEHLRPENKVKVMVEFERVLKVGGILDIAVPKFPSPASIQDPTHLSFWNRESFWYFTKGNKFGEGFVKRCPESPLFEFVEDDDSKDWEYKIKLKKI